MRFVVLATALVTASATAVARAPLDLSRLLDQYAAGRFDDAVRAVAEGPDEEATTLRQQWRTVGRLWIDAEPANASRRILAAAAFALETENLHVERGAWGKSLYSVCPPKQTKKGLEDVKGPAGACILTWTYEQIIQRGAPDEAEHAWLMATSALAGGVRDWRFLFRSTPEQTPDTQGLLADAVRRFPDDMPLRMERALAMLGRYSVTIDGAGPVPVVNLPAMVPGSTRARVLEALRARPDSRDNLIAELNLLGRDASVGAEARMRLGHLYWTTGEHEKARAELQAAAAAAQDSDVRYLAQFLMGWIAIVDDRHAGPDRDSAADLEAALATRPDSQSATLALAALELQRGNATRAYDLTSASLQARPTDADPWRLFLYGSHPHLAARISALRRLLLP